MKNFLVALLASAALFFSSASNATIIEYDFTVSGGWFDNNGNPYGMSSSPTLNGSITVDNTKSDFAALEAFSLTTGTKTWSVADFVGNFDDTITFDVSGMLTLFKLNPFNSVDGGSMYIYSDNTMLVADGSGASNACNGCVSIGQGTIIADVPEPTILALLSLGLVGLAIRKKA